MATKNRRRAVGGFCECAALPAVVSNSDAYAHAGRIDANPGPRALIIVAITIVPALIVTLARHVVVGIVVALDDHAAAATGAIAAPILVADQPNLLHESRIGVFVARREIDGLGAAAETERAHARHECNRGSPHRHI